MTRWDDAFGQPAPAPEPTNVTPLDPARASRYAAKALADECEKILQAPEGTRNHTLNTAAFSLGQLAAAGHLAEQDLVDSLSAAARRAGLLEGEIAATIRSGLTSGAQTPRIVPPAPELPDVTVLQAPDLHADVEHEFWDARPLLRHLHDFARARRVSPWAVLGVTLARIITATPHQVCLPPIIGGKASLNLFIGLVGPSGSGKGAAEAVAADAVQVGYITSHNVGSGEGIAHGYMRRVRGNLEWNDDQHAVLFSVPEIDSLAAQGDRKGATLMPQLRSGWTGEQLGFGYADPAKRILIPAHEYRLCLVAGIQPARAACLLDDADGGTPQRFLWMPATDPDAPDTPPAEPAPIAWTPPPVSDIVSFGGARLDVCNLAKKTIDDARVARLRGQGDALDGHALLAQLKTAAALGIADGRLAVTDDDWHLAAVILRKSASVRAGVAHHLRAKQLEANEDRARAEAHRQVHVEDALADAAVKRVCRVIQRRLDREPEDTWTARGVLHKAAAGRDRQYVEAALERLLEAGQIEADEAERTTKYRTAKGAS